MKVKLEDHGSVWLARPLDDEAQAHLEKNVGPEAQWFGKALVVEPRYVSQFAKQLTANGVEVS